MTIEIILNDTPHSIEVDNLAEALEALGYRDAVIATAVNRRFVQASARCTTRLLDGDEIEVVAPMQGG